MILLLDAGNSRLKWAVLRNGQFEHGGVLEHADIALKELATAAWGELDPPEAVWVANVAGEALRRTLNAWVKRRWKLTPEYPLATANAFGLQNAYAEPTRLGIDRWLALLAAREKNKGPFCVIDCGTALTIDVLSHDDRHLGGLIIPGVQLMRDALANRAEGIRERIETASHQQVSLLGSDTGSAVAGGSVYAAVAVIDRIYADLRTELGRRLCCILTGGDAPTLLPLLAFRAVYEEDLVLRGLARLVKTQLVDRIEPANASDAEPSDAAEGGAST